MRKIMRFRIDAPNTLTYRFTHRSAEHRADWPEHRPPLFTQLGNLAERSGLAVQREQQISLPTPALELASAPHAAERNHASQPGRLQTMTRPIGRNLGDARGGDTVFLDGLGDRAIREDKQQALRPGPGKDAGRAALNPMRVNAVPGGHPRHRAGNRASQGHSGDPTARPHPARAVADADQPTGRIGLESGRYEAGQREALSSL